jgi:hypothetical protein
MDMPKVDLPGAMHLVLPEGVAYLDPDRAVFEGMLEGWCRPRCRLRHFREKPVGSQ